MNTDGFILHVKPEDVYEDFSGDVELRDNAPNYEVSRSLPIWKKEKCDPTNKSGIEWKNNKKVLDERCTAI